MEENYECVDGEILGRLADMKVGTAINSLYFGWVLPLIIVTLIGKISILYPIKCILNRPEVGKLVKRESNRIAKQNKDAKISCLE